MFNDILLALYIALKEMKTCLICRSTIS